MTRTATPVRIESESSVLPASTVVAVACALIAAWVAAGSTGLLGHSLRHVLTWVFTGACVVAAWPRSGSRLLGVTLVPAVILLLLLTSAIQPAVNVAGVLVVLAVVAWLAEGASAAPLRAATGAVAIFSVYRLAVQAIPAVWMISDRVGEFLGRVAGLITRQPLWVGATFGGVDFLVLSVAFYGLWVARAPAPRWRRVVYGVAAIVLAHLAYLSLLSFAPAFLSNVPAPTPQQPNPIWTIALPGFLNAKVDLDAVAIRQLVPDNLPLFAALFHALVIAGILRWSPPAEAGSPAGSPKARGMLFPLTACIAALGLPLLTTYCTPARSLEGKKIVICDKLFGNFLKPQHGDYGHLSIGMYGSLQPFIESLGGKAVVSSNLSEQDLAGADALILIYPNKPFLDERIDAWLRFGDEFLGFEASAFVQQVQIDRIWKYVEKGGTLLVMGEHTLSDEHVPLPARSYVNQVLAPSKIRVNFDAATFDVGGWLQSYQALSHPITDGIEDSRNQFGVVIGASLGVRWPARPVLVGRWGFADPGDEGSSAAMMGNHHYDAGERLGDLCLIAEQDYGKGRLVAFGDPSNLTNGITIGAHAFNARLYSYLTHRWSKDGAGDTPQAPWREIVGVILAGVLIAFIARRSVFAVSKGPSPRPSPGVPGEGGKARTEPRPPEVPGEGAGVLAVGGIVLLMALSLWFWQWRVGEAAEMYPDGRKLPSSEIYLEPGKTQPNYSQVAYIDNAHEGFFSEESWRVEGTMGLAMNLMRNGYLTFMAPDLDKERLAGASFLAVPAPTRAFTAKERKDLKEWVDAGGTLVLTVGWDRYEPSRALLADFKFHIGKIPLDAFPAEAIDAVRRARPGYEVVAAGVDKRDRPGVETASAGKKDYGYYVFVVTHGNDAVELLVAQRSLSSTEFNQAMLEWGDRRPAPLGHFKAPYVDFGTYRSYVRFQSGWPVRSSDPMVNVVTYYGGGEVDLPVILWRHEGKGKVFLIGDSEFATNQNLEHEGGEAFEGMRENADFWRWIIQYYVRGEGAGPGAWRPPNPAAATKPAGTKGDGFELEGK